MIETPSVLILGAGASSPYGFPLGSGLLHLLLNLHNSNEDMDILENLGYSRSLFSDFQKALHTSQINSIDKFLGMRSEFGEIGKTAIALILLRCEKDPYVSLFNGTPPNDNWCRLLWNALITPNLSEFKNNKLSVITFNYDRSLETYLVIALANAYRIEIEEAHKAIKESIKITHVYGSLGELAPDPRPTREAINKYFKIEKSACIPFGLFSSEVSYNAVDIARHSLRLMGDRATKDNQKICEHAIDEAVKICFLGFGYDKQNLNQITATKKRLNTIQGEKGLYLREVFGSALGLTEMETKAAQSQICIQEPVGNGGFRFVNGNCTDTLRQSTVLF